MRSFPLFSSSFFPPSFALVFEAPQRRRPTRRRSLLSFQVQPREFSLVHTRPLGNDSLLCHRPRHGRVNTILPGAWFSGASSIAFTVLLCRGPLACQAFRWRLIRRLVEQGRTANDAITTPQRPPTSTSRCTTVLFGPVPPPRLASRRTRFLLSQCCPIIEYRMSGGRSSPAIQTSKF